MKMFLFFVDFMKGEIYGNYLEELDKERVSNGKQYPLNEATKYGQVIRYAPLSAMVSVAKLNEEELKELHRLQTA